MADTARCTQKVVTFTKNDVQGPETVMQMQFIVLAHAPQEHVRHHAEFFGAVVQDGPDTLEITGIYAYTC